MNEQNYVGGSVSKSYARMKQAKYKGISLKIWLVFGLWVIGSLVILNPLSKYDLNVYSKMFVLAVFVVWWLAYFKFARDNRVIERSIVHIKFLRRAFRGETELAKFVHDTSFLERFTPIKQIHDDGFIQYLNGTWGVMLKIRATRVPGDALFFHLEGIRHLHDGLYGRFYITIISTTVLNHENLLVDKLLEKSKVTKSVPQKEHLVDMHNMVEKNNSNYRGHEICMVVNVGPHTTLEYAQIARDSFVPGYIDALEKANCTGHVILSKSQIYQEYRSKFNPMRK